MIKALDIPFSAFFLQTFGNLKKSCTFVGNYNTLYLIHMKSHLLFLLLTFGTCVFAQHGTINIQTNLDSTSILQ